MHFKINMAKEKQKNLNKGGLNIPLIKMVLGVTSIFIGFILLVSFSSYLSNWQNDQNQIGIWNDPDAKVQNILGKLGAWLGEVFIYDNIGAAALFIPLWLLILGIMVIFKIRKIKFLNLTLNFIFFCIWLPLFLSLILPHNPVWGGRMGFELKDYLINLIDILGLVFVIVFSFILYAVLEWKITPDKIKSKMPKVSIPSPNLEKDFEKEKVTDEGEVLIDSIKENNEKEVFAENTLSDKVGRVNHSFDHEDDEDIEFIVKEKQPEAKSKKEAFSFEVEQPKEELNIEEDMPNDFEPEITEIIIEPDEEDGNDLQMTVETVKEEEVDLEDLSEQLVQKHGEYDPRLDLANYKFPTIDLLIDYNKGKNLSLDKRELESNKDKIVETLSNYKINIESIKATVGPTVTLYEIVPEAGVRISKIKNLEDDIALSLSALGIRIIAPIPGKGTIGIEVPNSNPSMVSMRSVIASQKFQSCDMELPIAFGKTISNETFVADLAKMPHLLMAGATGQGKSVGINAIISSLLYKKHPAELKFVMVDPKKVELALYNKIERHFLAKLPGLEDAIVTDNTKVIHTLNSLCIEMDDRYDLLKDAYVRNIKEYNVKFKKRKLNPENGHRFMPYIVLVVDEFADLIMTAGKEVEAPIARLAQLARAVGIHLVIATQRPSVNVITGIIKANFPSRAAFRVTSKIDSRTILDSGGAEQLIGKGDMLYTKGNDLVRLQCAFVDTPEVENVAEYIGGQKGYPDAFLLPEYEGEGGDSILDIDPSDRDSLFDDAARIVVSTQQGSASMLQRKLKIGYNRAGRIIDQLEANNIVGPFEGSKAREVLIADEYTLEQLLKND